MSDNILSNNDVFPQEEDLEDDTSVMNPAPEGCPTATTMNEVQSDADFSATENDDDDEWDPLIPPGGFTPLPSIPEEQPQHIPIGPTAGWFCHICGYDNMLVDDLFCRICGRPPDARDLKETPDITLNEPLLENPPSTIEVWQCGGCSTMNDFVAGQEVHTCVQCQHVVDSTSEVFLSFSIPEEEYAEIVAQRKKPSPQPDFWNEAPAVPFGGGVEAFLQACQTISSSTAQTHSTNCFSSMWQPGEVSSPTYSQLCSPPPVDIDFFGYRVEDEDTEPQPVVDPAAPSFESLGPGSEEPGEGQSCAELDSFSSLSEPTPMNEDACDLVRKRGFENVMGDEGAGETEPPKKKRRVSPPPIDGSTSTGEGDADVVMSDGGELMDEDTPREVYEPADQNATEEDV